jgi:hypothetical protein
MMAGELRGVVNAKIRKAGIRFNAMHSSRINARFSWVFDGDSSKEWSLVPTM